MPGTVSCAPARRDVDRVLPPLDVLSFVMAYFPAKRIPSPGAAIHLSAHFSIYVFISIFFFISMRACEKGFTAISDILNVVYYSTLLHYMLWSPALFYKLSFPLFSPSISVLSSPKGHLFLCHFIEATEKQ